MIKSKEIPAEVWLVFSIQYNGVPIGTTAYEHCQKIIDKYPEHFPWEHRYKKIPQEVHDAYNKEKGFSSESLLMKTPLFDDVKSNPDGGIFQAMKEQEVQMKKQREEDKGKDFRQLFTEFYEALGRGEETRRKEVKRSMDIWNKHYKPYGLEFRPNAYERKYL